MSSLYNQLHPGVLVTVANKKESRVRRAPTKADPNNVVAWLEERTTAVVLQPPPDWSGAYPAEQDGCTWVYVFSDLAVDHPDKTRFRAAVGWIAAGPSGAAQPTDRYLSPLDPRRFAA